MKFRKSRESASSMGLAVMMVCAALLLFAAASTAEPRTTAFSYQGQLKQGGAPASGMFDFRFSVFDDENAGGQVGETLSVDDLAVQNGLFSTSLDFGNSILSEMALWLEVEVRPGGSTGAYTTLSPRQPLYLFSRNGKEAPFGAALTGAVTVGSGSDIVTGTGTFFTQELRIGDSIMIDSEIFTVEQIDNDQQLRISSPHTVGALNVTAFSDGTMFEVRNGAGEPQFAIERLGIVVGSMGSPITRIEHGTIGICEDGMLTSGQGTESFSSPFREAPMIFLTPNRNSGATCNVTWVENVDAESFLWFAYNTALNGLIGCDCVYWLAIGTK